MVYEEDGFLVADDMSFQLPIDYTLGFPQAFFVVIKNVTFMIIYRFNSRSDALIMTIIRNTDQKTVFHGKLSDGSPIQVYDPDWHRPYFAIFPESTSRTDLSILILTKVTS